MSGIFFGVAGVAIKSPRGGSGEAREGGGQTSPSLAPSSCPCMYYAQYAPEVARYGRRQADRAAEEPGDVKEGGELHQRVAVQTAHVVDWRRREGATDLFFVL